MKSTLVLDRSDPEVNALVAGWEDGQSYNLKVTVKQLSSSPAASTFDVVELVDESGDTEEAASTEPEAPAKAPPKKTVTVYPK